jgi:queuine tRNA-ribosyltransferase
MKQVGTFDLYRTDDGSGARTGSLVTARGAVETPVFMPVGTQATVKTLSGIELDECGVEIILANTYHLFLRPGDALIQEMGGLHRFMNWDKPVLTDSGGYQVLSLSDLRKLDADGVTFKSHIDGAWNRFTPEGVAEIQKRLGSDIAMVLDDCAPYPCDEARAGEAVRRTVSWAERSLKNRVDSVQLLFAIVQGGTFSHLRAECASQLVAMNFPGYAIGGLSVGEPKSVTMDTVAELASILPAEKPRYLMGVGYVEDIMKAVACGIDMFDCVIPTRNGRNGTCFTHRGKVVVKNAIYARDPRPIEDGCGCFACRTYSRAYIRHLFHVGELLAPRLATLHNIHFFVHFLKEIREAIKNGTFSSWQKKTLDGLNAIEKGDFE